MSSRIDCFSAPAPAPDGPGPVNSWIVGDDEEVIVIDPGADATGLLDAVGDREVLAVICTHGHADHVAAAFEVAERDEAPVALHPKDRSLWRGAPSRGGPAHGRGERRGLEGAGFPARVIPPARCT